MSEKGQLWTAGIGIVLALWYFGHQPDPGPVPNNPIDVPMCWDDMGRHPC